MEQVKRLCKSWISRKWNQRIVSLVLAVVMALGMCYSAIATLTEGAAAVCPEHTGHDAACGYIPAVAGVDCVHKHTETCYEESLSCAHKHEDACYEEEELVCVHEHGADCFVQSLSCTHKHDGNCGYEAAVDGKSCKHVCAVCNAVSALTEVKGSYDLNPDGKNHADIEISFEKNSDSFVTLYKKLYDENGKPVLNEQKEEEYELLKRVSAGLGEYTLNNSEQTIILTAGYLNTLPIQKHEFRMVFKSGAERLFELKVEDTSAPGATHAPEKQQVPKIGDMAAIMTYNGPMSEQGIMALNGAGDFGTMDAGIDQGLIAEFLPVSADTLTGNAGSMRLYASLSSTDNHSITVRLPIPQNVPGLEFPDFVTVNSTTSKYTVYANGIQIDLTMTKNGSGIPQYIEFVITEGMTIISMVKVSVPNGYSSNPTNVVFPNPTIASSTPNFVGNRELVGGTLRFTAKFGWDGVKVTANPTSTQVTQVSGVDRLRDDIKYTFTAQNSFAGLRAGVIFTQSYSLSGTITLPGGMDFPAGAGALNANGTSFSIGGVVIATFSKAVASASVSGKVLSFQYAASNSTLNASGNPISGAGSDMANLDLVVTLQRANLTVTVPTVNGQKILCAGTFQAIPCKQTAATHNSNGNAETIITYTPPSPVMTISKTNNPGNSTTITSTDTPITYTITVKNTGSVSTSATVTDTLPSQMVFVSASPTDGASGFSHNTSTNTISWTTGTMAPGAEKVYTIVVKVAPGLTARTTITNTARAVYNGTTISATATNTYDPPILFTIKKTVDKANVWKDDVVRYTITVTSKDTAAKIGQTVVDTLPAGIILTTAQVSALEVAYGSANVNYNTSTRRITISNRTIPAGGTLVITFDATITGLNASGGFLANGTKLRNTVEITALGLSDYAESTYNRREANVSAKKTSDNLKKVADNRWEADYRISVTNLGDATSGLDVPLTFQDVMSGGLRPYNAQPNHTAASGTMTGTNNKGQTVTGTWTRSGSGSAAVYTVTWQIPTLAPGETYWISYKGEIEVTLKPDGSFDSFTASNTMTIKGTVKGTPGGGTTHPIKLSAELSKVIQRVNGTLQPPTSRKNGEIYPGDVVDYTLYVVNNETTNLIGTLTDILPAIRPGSGFAWVWGDTVKLREGDAGNIGNNYTPTLVNGVLTWSNISLPPGSSGVTIVLTYPTEGFEAAFGRPGDVVVNTAQFVPQNGNFILRDSTTQTIKDLDLTISKTVNKNTIDASASTTPERTAVFTLHGIATPSAVTAMVATDDLTNVRTKFDIVSVNYGVHNVTNLAGTTVGYTIVLTFADGTTTSVNVPAGGNATALVAATYSGAKIAANIVSIEWNFGTVRRVLCTTEPTITVLAKTGVAPGTVRNLLDLAYSGKYKRTECPISLTDSNTLSKKMYDANGEQVLNDSATLQASSEYTFEVVFTNLLGRPINATEVAWMKDGLATQLLDDSVPIVFTVSHLLASGGSETVTGTRTFAPGWGTGSGEIAPGVWAEENAQGTKGSTFTLAEKFGFVWPTAILPAVIAENDKIIIRCTVRTKESLMVHAGQFGDAHRLHNGFVINITDEAELETFCGPFFVPAGKAYLSLKTSIVGTGYGTVPITGSGVSTMYDNDWAGQNVGNNNFMLKGLPIMANDTTSYGRHVIVDVTLTNHHESGYILVDSGVPWTTGGNAFRVTAPEGYVCVGMLTGPTFNPSTSGGRRTLALSRNSASPSDSQRMIIPASAYLRDDLGRSISAMGSKDTRSNSVAFNGGTGGRTVDYTPYNWDNDTISGIYPHLDPGSAWSVRLVFCETEPAYNAPDEITFSAQVSLNGMWLANEPKSGRAGQAVSAPAGTTVIANGGAVWGTSANNYADSKIVYKDMRMDGMTTYDNHDVQGKEPLAANIGNFYTTNASGGSSNPQTIAKSDVTIRLPKYDLGITKEITGFRAAGTSDPWMPMDGSTVRAPGINDEFQVKIRVKNDSDINLTNYIVFDQFPVPYDSGTYGGTNRTIETMYNASGVSIGTITANTLRSNTASDVSPTILAASRTYFTWDNSTKAKGVEYWGKMSALSDPYNSRGSTIAMQMTSSGRFQSGTTGSSRLLGGLLPGYVHEIELLMRPISGLTPDYMSYDNDAYVYTYGATIENISVGESIRESGRIVGAKNGATVELGGNFASMSQKRVVKGAAEASGRNSAANTIEVAPTDTFRYELLVESKASMAFQNMVVIDRLPMLADRGAVNGASLRGSQFPVRFAPTPNLTVEVQLTGSTTWTPISSANYKVEYRTVTSTDQFSADEWSGVAFPGTWVATPVVAHNALRVCLTGYNLPAKATLRVSFDAQLTNPSTVTAGQIAWNSFGYRYMAHDDALGGVRPIIAEPAKVGVRIGGAKLEIDKKVKADGSPLAGVIFGVFTDAACTTPNRVATMTTLSDGKVTSSTLFKQQYYVKEISAPAGYFLSTQVFPVDLTNATTATVKVNSADIVNSTTPINLKLTKELAPGSTITAPITINVTGVFYDQPAGTPPMTKSVVFSASEASYGLVEKTITNLIAGNMYTITESGGGKEFSFTASGTYPGGETFVVSGGSFTMGKDGTIAIVNHDPLPGTLRIRKVMNLANGGTDGGETFTIEVRGAFSDGDSVKRFNINASQRDTWITVPNVILGQTYTIRESGYYESKYTVAYTAEAVTISTAGRDVTITNTPKVPGNLEIIKKISGVKPTTDVGSFTVRVTGKFSDTSARYKDVILDIVNGYSETVTGLIIGETYSVEEINIPAIYGVPEYTGLSGAGTVVIDSQQNKQVTVNNIPREGALFSLEKGITANRFNRMMEFVFTLTGPAGANSQTHTGRITTASNGVVIWDGNGSILELKPGTYTLQENSNGDGMTEYQFKDWNVVNHLETAEPTVAVSTSNPVTFTLTAGETAKVIAANEVKKSSVKFTKTIQDVNGNAQASPASQALYIGLYQGTDDTPFMVKELLWNGTKYADLSFDNVPYGEYKYFELIKDGGDNYIKVSAPGSNFDYSVVGEGEFTLDSTTQLALSGTGKAIQNNRKYTVVNIAAAKVLSNTDKDILADRIFKVHLVRADGGVVANGQTDLVMELKAATWTAALQNLHLTQGEYLLYEEKATDSGWAFVSIAGTCGSAAMASHTMPGGEAGLKFAVSYNDLGSNMEVSLSVENKATAKKLDFAVSKLVNDDEWANLQAPQRTFTFGLYKVENTADQLVATGTLIKSAVGSQQVVSWTAAAGGTWVPAQYLWELNATYKIIEDNTNNYYTLTNVAGGSELYDTSGGESVLIGVSFAVTSEMNTISLAFENTRNIVNNIWIKKEVVSVLTDENGQNPVETPVAVTGWPAGSSFEFWIYNEDVSTGLKYVIGTITVTDGQPTIIQTSTEPLLLGNTYYIRETKVGMAGRYLDRTISYADGRALDIEEPARRDVPGEADVAAMYSFIANGNLVLRAVNELLEITEVKLKVVKNLVDSAGNAAVSRRAQTFVFQISNGTQTFFEYITVPAGSSSASAWIVGIPKGTYTVKELNSNWRYTLVSENNITKNVVDPEVEYVFTFKNKLTNDFWLDNNTKVTNEMPPLVPTN